MARTSASLARAIVAVVAACLVCAWGAPARAQDIEDVQSSAAARALFDEGIACVDHDDWVCAADRFHRAYALRPSPVIASNLAHALVRLDRLVEGSELLTQLVHNEAAPARLRTDAQRTIDQISPRIGRLTVALSGPMDGVSVTVDGAAFPESLHGAAAPSDPGDHVVEAHRGGEVVASSSVHIDPGGSAQAELTIPALPPPPVVEPALAVSEPAPPPPPALETPAPPPPRGHEVYEEWWFWTIVGVVVVGAGVTVGVVASQPGTTLPSGSLGTFDGR